MSVKTFVASQSGVWLIVAILLLVIPRQFVGTFGPALDAGATVVARLFGAELTALAIVSYLETARNWPRAPVMTWLAYTTSNTLGTLVTLQATLSGVLNPRGWALVVLYLFYAVGFAVILIRRPGEKPS